MAGSHRVPLGVAVRLEGTGLESNQRTVKTFDKSRGWLVPCRGGELDGIHVRTWCLQEDPAAEADAMPESFRVTTAYGPAQGDWAVDTRGEYVLRLTGKTAKYKGTLVPAREYVWTESN